MDSKQTYSIVIAASKAATRYTNGDKILLKEKYDGFEVYKQTGNAIKSLEFEAQKIIEFLHLNYPVKIDQIVLDFIKDSSNTWWFLGCKGFKLDEKV
jgi:hypothetical protein